MAADGIILETRGLTMRFGGVVAVNNVDFSMKEGELRCLIGPNGAGKSTFFKCLTRQYKPTSGQVLFRGTDITGEIDLKDQLYMRPRTSDFVSRNGNTAKPTCPGSNFP